MSDDERRRLLLAARTGELGRVVSGWILDHLPPGWLEALEHDAQQLRRLRDGIDEQAWWVALADAGLTAPTWPQELGGLGFSPREAGVIAAELRRFKTPRSRNPIGLNMVAPALLTWGNEQQQREFLPGIARQTEIWCQLFSEPGAGSDLASLATRARRHGDEWTVDGQKVWTSLAHEARWGILLARTDASKPKHEGITAFLVDMHAPGVEVRPLRQITGDAEFNEVFLDGVRVPDRHRLGAEGQGWSIARSILTHERASDSGAGVLPGVIAGRRVDELVRRGGVTGSLRGRVVRAWLSEQTLALTIGRSRAVRRAKGAGVDGTVTKLMSTEHSQSLQDLALDLALVDGPGWSLGDRWTDGTAWSYLRVQSKSIAGGTLDITKNLCGERVLGLAREPSVERGQAWQDVLRSNHHDTDQERSAGL